MPKGILYVESEPISSERADEYHEWYTRTHIPEVCGIDGFVSARRFAPVDGEGPFVAIYEIEADDLQAAVAALSRAAQGGDINMSDAMRMDPPPSIRLLELIASFEPATDG